MVVAKSVVTFVPKSSLSGALLGNFSSGLAGNRVGGFNANRVLDAYVEIALWVGADEDGNSLDQTYSDSDLSDEARAEMRKDVEDFLESSADDLRESGLDESDIGGNFFLTRNRHGAGFWDLGLGAVGERLTKAAHVYGTQGVYAGDDGKLYVHG